MAERVTKKAPRLTDKQTIDALYKEISVMHREADVYEAEFEQRGEVINKQAKSLDVQSAVIDRANLRINNLNRTINAQLKALEECRVKLGELIDEDRHIKDEPRVDRPSQGVIFKNFNTDKVRWPIVGEEGSTEKVLGSNDPVHHPNHYTSGSIETWDYIVDQNLGYLLGNVVKYVSRAGKKDPALQLQDLEKAQAYLAREIKRVKDDV